MKKIYTLLSFGTFSLAVNTLQAQCTIPSLVTASPSAICVGATTTLNATSLGSSISWFTLPVAGSSIGTSASGTNINFTPTITTTYYAEAFVVGTSTTQVYNYTGAVQTFTVPAGITQMTIDAKGAQGGGTFGGNGGRTQAVINVTPGEVLNFYVGSKPTIQMGPGGYNGGGAVTALPCGGGSDGFPGGGATDIRRAGTTLVNRIIVAGGGGGQGYSNGVGGLGGGLIAADGATSWITGTNGKGGNQTVGGAGGIYSAGTAPSGSLGIGGNSGPTSTYCTGGAGGGGYYGGGGGYVSAGGGGSNYVLAGSTSTVFTQGTQTGNGQLSISYLGVGCTSVSRTAVTVTVDPIPTVVVNSGAICAGKSFTMVPSGASTYTYSGGSAVVSPTITSSYTVTGTSAAGCLGTSGAVSIVSVNTLPVITVTSGSICSGNSFTMFTSGASTYSYSSGSAVNSPTISTSYTVTGASVAGCTNTAISSVTVNANPIVTVTSGAICSGKSFTMVASGAGTFTYSSGSAVVTPTANTTYTVTGSSVAGCTNTAVSSVTVNATPTISVTSGAICAGKSFTLVASGAGTYTYSSGSAVVTPTVNTTYSVTGTSTLGCVGSNTAVSSVTVNANPTVAASTSNSVICLGQSVVLTASTSATSYTWNNAATTMSVSVTPSVTSTYTVSVSNSVACVATSTVMVMVNTCTGINEILSNSIFVYPNPNNGILNISLTSELSKNSSLEIYDAVGKLVVKQVLANELNTINISDLDNGIYTFKVLNNTNTVKIGKLIKQ
jgi:hypothetical protein